jgi:hypothetical protein
MLLPFFSIVTARKPLRKITTNYTPRSASALQLAMELSGDSQTDTLNRAIQIHAYLLHLRKEGGADADTASRLLGLL